MAERTVYLATRGSALALAQANLVLAQCRSAFPDLSFEIKIIKTTGDKLQTASLVDAKLPKGLFTKELEIALLSGEAGIAVHSLKDLPTALPPGLKLGAVSERVDPRDVLIHRTSENFGLRIADLPKGATVATSSTRRSAQLLERRPDLRIVPIRGNVGTRLNKLVAQREIAAIILAAAGLERLGVQIAPNGMVRGKDVADGLIAAPIDPSEMLPCVGQAALGIEIREDDDRARQICERLNDPVTMQCVRAEREFLRAMGGGCQIPVAAYAEATGPELHMRAVSFLAAKPRRGEGRGALTDPEALGSRLARQIQAEE
jgi:hydroxymethylbilane synthase